MPDYSWPPMEKRRVMGKRISRLDGPDKSRGKAKYNSDLNRPGTLHAVMLTSPYAHARVKSIDTSAAAKMNGVKAVRVISGPGTEIQWAGTEMAIVAAETETAARDAVRAIKVDYEILPHVVREEDLTKVGTRAKPAGEQVTGDPDKGFQESEVVSEASYGIPVITHCCLEPHGQVVEWKGDKMEYFPSTQAVSTIGGDLAKQLEVPATQIHVHQDHMGGGFGSKFQSDRWGAECARLSKETGGAPVKLFLDRATELTVAGVRPSIFGKIKVGAKKDGTLVAWQSDTWATGGVGGGKVAAQLFPYVFQNVPNRRVNHTAVSLNAGGARAWRAPNHPQVSFITCSALEDLAAKLNMDPLQLFLKNVNFTARPETYTAQLNKAAEIIEWKKNWHPRGQGGSGHIKRGLGIGVNTWGGAGHNSRCKTTIHPDGNVEVELGTQDLGVGNRTIIVQVAAETLGLPMSAIKLNIGDSSFPASGPSGGSTTVGGVSSSTRKSTVNALDKLFAAVAPSMSVQPDQLEAVDGRIQVKGNPSKSLTWQAACQKLGVASIVEMGENDGRSAPREGLNTQGASGVQMADVSVDTETGIVKMNRLVAVQDCGLIINPKTAESQIMGACIMSICAALMEERIMDQQTGRVLNADMEFYKLAGIGDIGEITVHLNLEPEHDKRGVIGLGEPPAIGGIAAIANAVANAIGVRVPMVPLTPDRVIAALERRNA
jgi:xanthine dehydrogenase YagR molybdenum-binding subunit